MSTQSYRPLLRSLYPLGVLIILTSLVEPTLRVMPFNVSNVAWRFGAVGFFSTAVIGVVFGLAILMLVAAMLDHRGVLRFLGAGTIAVGGIVGIVLVFFVLDTLQVRATVNPELIANFDTTVIRATLTLAVMIPVSLWMGSAGWRSTQREARVRRSEGAESPTLLVHPRTQGGANIV